MFGIGFPELILICVAVLLFVGPKKLPDVMKQAGRFFVQIRRTANDVRGTFDQVVREAEDEIRKEEAAALRALTPTTARPVTPEAIAAPDSKPFDPHHQPTQHVDDGHNPDGTLKTTEPSQDQHKPTNA